VCVCLYVKVNADVRFSEVRI